MKTKSHKKDKINVITLGCSKNLVDSEVLVSQLKYNDYEVSHQSEEATKDDSNIIIINTCGFIDRAKEESINTILTYADKKQKGEIDKLFVTGCLSQRYKDDLEEEIPAVDAFFGTLEMPALLEKLNADYKHDLIGERVLATPMHYAYLKISEGCNRTCSFCAIPLMRGKHISRTIESLVEETKSLARQGVKEIMLIAQELTYYGLDIYKSRELPKLLKALNEVDGIEWIRLHYAYPSKFPIEIIESIKENDKVCNYLDIPLQHISDPILKAMKRQITKGETIDLIKQIRNILPEIALRTTMLVGFPGETEEDFKELCDFVKERAAILMEIQQEISTKKNDEKIGKTFKVLIDRKEGGFFVGRTEFDSPEVDNEVLIDAKKHFCRVGDFVEATIDDATDFDLYASL